jgi:hypothetical protein
MANHLRGEVEIAAGDRKLVFRLGVNEMIAIQNDFGLAGKDEEFSAALMSLRGFARPRIVFYHGLRARQPDITIEEVGDIMTAIGMPRVDQAIVEAVRWALPDKEPGDDEGGDARPFGGPTSS